MGLPGGRCAAAAASSRALVRALTDDAFKARPAKSTSGAGSATRIAVIERSGASGAEDAEDAGTRIE